MAASLNDHNISSPGCSYKLPCKGVSGGGRGLGRPSPHWHVETCHGPEGLSQLAPSSVQASSHSPTLEKHGFFLGLPIARRPHLARHNGMQGRPPVSPSPLIRLLDFSLTTDLLSVSPCSKGLSWLGPLLYENLLTAKQSQLDRPRLTHHHSHPRSLAFSFPAH